MIPIALLPLIKHFEGFHRVVRTQPVITAAPYLCPANFWTIGYGILCQRDHPEITLEEGEALLLDVAPAYVAHALRLSPCLAAEPENRLAAIADFIFNLGPTRYAGSTLRRRVAVLDWKAAAEQMRLWKFGGGRELPGLVLRREAEVRLLLA